MSFENGMTMLLLLSCLTTLSLLVPRAEAVWLTIPSSGTKCVSEEMQPHVVVLADYYVVPDEGHHQLHTISATVCAINPLNLVENIRVILIRWFGLDLLATSVVI